MVGAPPLTRQEPFGQESSLQVQTTCNTGSKGRNTLSRDTKRITCHGRTLTEKLDLRSLGPYLGPWTIRKVYINNLNICVPPTLPPLSLPVLLFPFPFPFLLPFPSLPTCLPFPYPSTSPSPFPFPSNPFPCSFLFLPPFPSLPFPFSLPLSLCPPYLFPYVLTTSSFPPCPFLSSFLRPTSLPCSIHPHTYPPSLFACYLSI